MKRIASRGSGVLLIWAAILAVLWVVAWAIFDPDTTTFWLGFWMPASLLPYAAWAFWRERRSGTPGDVRAGAVVDGSHATALLGLAIIFALLSTEFGPWLAYVSAGMALVALGGLVREARATRETLQRVRERERRQA